MISVAKKTKRVPAVAYVRMSSDRQEDSPQQQREQIVKLAEQGSYQIIRWYQDDAISGDDTMKRKQFRRMLEDAHKKGDYKAILCWDQDRFGRFNSLEAGHWIWPLFQKGICLVTVAQGVIDWNSFENRMMYSITQESKHSFCRDLARNILRAQLSHIDEGSFIRSSPPGLVRVFYDREGNEIKRVAWNEKFRRSNRQTVKLAISDNASEVDAMRWAFRTYGRTECSLKFIARGLAERGLLTKAGTILAISAVKSLLSNKKYVGKVVIGRFAKGKYYRMGPDGQIVEAREAPVTSANGSRQEPVSVLDETHEALVDQDLFDQCQAKLKRRGEGYQRQHADTKHLLTGLMKCADCGGKMSPNNGGNAQHRLYYYRCYGDDRGQCDGSSIRADEIEPLAISAFFDSISKLREQIKAKVAGEIAERKRSLDPTNVERRIADVDRQLERARRNFLIADPEDALRMKEIMSELRQERDRLAEDVELTANVDKVRANAEAKALAFVDDLRERFEDADPSRMKAVLQEYFAAIVVKCDRPKVTQSKVFRKRGKCRTVSEVRFEYKSGVDNQSFPLVHAALRINPESFHCFAPQREAKKDAEDVRSRGTVTCREMAATWQVNKQRATHRLLRAKRLGLIKNEGMGAGSRWMAAG